MKNVFLLFIILLGSLKNYAQSDTALTKLSGDTLYIGTGHKITVGQKIIVGKGSEDNGWYKSIRFKSSFASPIWLFKNSELDNKYQYQPDAEQRRENDKVMQSFSPNDSLTVVKIKRKGNKHSGYWYSVILQGIAFPKTKFDCNIEMAIKHREILKSWESVQ